MIVVITIIIYYIYPIADSLKYTNGGSDQDDGLIQGAIAIIEGKSPYSVTSYYGNPSSAGPGWIILLLPLSVFNLYWLVTPLSLLILIYSNYISGRSIYYTNILICLLCSSLAFWEVLVVGSDFIAFSALLVALGNLIVRFKDSIFILLLIALVVGMVSTARVFFIITPFVYSFLFWPYSKQKTIMFCLTSFTICLTIHIIFYLLSATYSPLHIIAKSTIIMHNHFIIILKY